MIQPGTKKPPPETKSVPLGDDNDNKADESKEKNESEKEKEV